MPVVPVCHRVLRAREVFFSCRHNLAPFLFELPRAYSKHERLFRAIGVAEHPDPPALARALQDLHTEVGADRRLNPSEASACHRVLDAYVAADSAKVRDGRAKRRADESLVVPDSTGRLAHTSKLLYNDAPHLLRQLHRPDFRFASHRLSRSMCRRLGIAALSEAVTETFKPPTAAAGPEPLPPGLFDAILELLHLYSATVPPDALEVMEEAARELQTFSVWRAPALDVKIVDRRRRRDVTSAAVGAVTYVDRGARRIWVSELLPPGVDAEAALGAAVNRVVAPGFPLPLAGVLRAARVCPGPEAFGEAVAALELSQAEQGDFRRGVPGQPVEAGDVELLQMKPLRPFHAREICAVAVNGGREHGATAASTSLGSSRLRPRGGDRDTTAAGWSEDGGAPANHEGLVYGEVLSETTGTGAPLPAYTVRVGPTEVVQFLPTDMYSFKTRPARLPPRGGAQSDAAAAAAAAATMEAFDADLVVPLGDDEAAAGGRGGGARGGQGLQTHGVAEAEYLQAVSSLLSRAGLSLHPDAEKMMGRVLALEQDNATKTAALSETKAELDKAKKTLNVVENERTCTICFMGAEDEVEVNTALTPCGHCYCADCARRLVGSKCPTCKRNASGSLKVFR